MQHFGKHLLNRLDELIDEGVKLFGRRPRLPHAEIERVVQVVLVVGAGVEIDRQQTLRRNAGAGRVQLQFSDRDADAVGAEIAKPEDAPAVGDADNPHVLLRPVAQDIATCPRRFIDRYMPRGPRKM